MNKNNLVKNFKNMELPEIELQGHKRNLKRALFSRQKFSSESGYFNIFNMNLLKKIAPVGGVVAVALVVALFNFGPKTVPEASAKEVAEKSYEAVVSLSPEQKEVFGDTVDDWAEILKEAINAPDLKLLSYDELLDQEDYTGSQTAVTPSKSSLDKQGIGLEDLQFLQYTTNDGVLMSIGIDPETSLPEALR